MDIFFSQYRERSTLDSHVKSAGLVTFIRGWNEPQMLCGKFRHGDELDCLSVVVSVEFLPIAGVLEEHSIL